MYKDSSWSLFQTSKLIDFSNVHINLIDCYNWEDRNKLEATMLNEPAFFELEVFQCIFQRNYMARRICLC